MKFHIIASLLLLAYAMPAFASSDSVIVTISIEESAAVSEDLTAEMISAKVTNISGGDIKNVTLRPDGPAHALATGALLQYGALPQGATKTIRTLLHRSAAGPDEDAPATWRLDFEEASGQHQRLLIATE
jgi:hypothetical protein